jgi:hypothetical protein
MNRSTQYIADISINIAPTMIYKGIARMQSLGIHVTNISRVLVIMKRA